LIMSRPFHLPFLGVVHHVTLCHLSFPFPIRLILLPEGSLYRPWVFPDVGVSSFSLMGVRGIFSWKTLWALMTFTSHWHTSDWNSIPFEYCWWASRL
jgi:hypothetical protein